MSIDPRDRLRRTGRWAASASLAAAFVCALAVSPPVASTSTDCPPAESLDFRTGVCVPTQPTGIVSIKPDPYDGLPVVDGVECTGHNSYECIGLAEENQAAGPTPTPHSTFSAEATPAPSPPAG